MQRSMGKIFIAAALGVALALSGTALLSRQQAAVKDAPAAAALNGSSRQLALNPSTVESTSASAPTTTTTTNDRESNDAHTAGFEEGYRAGYQDAQRDASTPRTVAPATYPRTTYRHARARVAGVKYVAERSHGHSTRSMILRIAAPAAIGAGIGAIAGGGKGAGAGALIGGGAGALYHLIKH